MTAGYFLGREVRLAGPCDDGWVWGEEAGKAGCWYWAPQVMAAPWGAT